ncbi:hypothetical protein VFPPC_12900 [Pochonia chlamydosporia 170]|uniref:Uncharacterized protein n=1 Tax=Pochonia chlamydosporia 170 TaxID=1380566 RepID=A0A179G652_METCM|nr:hypothetical protein VFPPC_12900 [Pochonia chlamydosporia 170]OAQ72980.1 hypothetical protein VFPPC_12900 [Pochonia chlamydosporia 170]
MPGPLKMSQRLQKAKDKAGEFFDEAIASSREFLKKHSAPMDEGDDDIGTVERLVGPPRPIFDELWTREDEASLRNAWEMSQLHDDLRSTSRVKFMAKLWTACYNTMHCSPCALVSPRYKLIFQGSISPKHDDSPEPDNSLGQVEKIVAQLVAPTQGASNAISTLVCHPLWQGNPSFLATAIQCAVICRTDDRRPWVMALTARNIPEIEALRERVACPQTEPISATLAQCVQGISGGDVVPTLLAFLDWLAQRIKRPEMAEVEGDGGMYHVQLRDLNNIIGALDTFTCRGFPRFMNTEFIEAATRWSLSQLSFPKQAEVVALHERSTLHELRMFSRSQRRMGRDSPMDMDMDQEHDGRPEAIKGPGPELEV